MNERQVCLKRVAVLCRERPTAFPDQRSSAARGIFSRPAVKSHKGKTMLAPERPTKRARPNWALATLSRVLPAQAAF